MRTVRDLYNERYGNKSGTEGESAAPSFAEKKPTARDLYESHRRVNENKESVAYNLAVKQAWHDYEDRRQNYARASRAAERIGRERASTMYEGATGHVKPTAEDLKAIEFYNKYAGEYGSFTPEQQAAEAKRLYGVMQGWHTAPAENGRFAPEALPSVPGLDEVKQQTVQARMDEIAGAPDRYQWFLNFGDKDALADERMLAGLDEYLKDYEKQYTKAKKRVAEFESAFAPDHPQYEYYKRKMEDEAYPWIRIYENQLANERMMQDVLRIQRTPDFEQKAVKGDYTTPEEDFDAEVEKYQLTDPTARKVSKDNTGMTTWEQLTDDEKKIWYYKKNVEGDEAAKQYLDAMAIIAAQRAEGKYASMVANGDVLDKIAFTIASIPASVYGAPEAFLADIADASVGKYNPYSANPYRLAQAGRRAIAEDIEGWVNDKTDSEFLSKAAPFLYNTALSTADSALGAASLGEAYTVIMGMGAASTRARELYEAGERGANVVVGAGLDGIAEALFEYVSLENLLSEKTISGFWSFVKEVMKQGGVEASEEAATGIANVINDIMVRGERSEAVTKYKDYLKKNGGDEYGALWATINDETGNILLEAGAGFLSGATLGFAFNIRNIDHIAKAEAKVQNTGDAIAFVNNMEAQRIDAAFSGDLSAEQAAAEAEKRVADKFNLSAYGVEVTAPGEIASSDSFKSEFKKRVVRKVKEAMESEASKDYLTTDSGVTEYAHNGKVDEGVVVTRIIDRDGERMYELGSGDVVSADSVTFGKKAEATVYGMLNDYKVDGESATQIAKDVLAEVGDNAETVKTAEAAMNAINAYNYGELGLDYASAVKTSKENALSSSVMNAAYDLGRAQYEARAAERQAAVDRGELTYRRKGEGKVVYEDSVTDEVLADMKDKNIDKTDIEALDRLASALGINIHLYATQVGEHVKRSATVNGKTYTSNGFYDHATGDIYIDVYSGRKGNSLMMFTLAHELTHFIAQNSPAQYKAMADFLVKTYGEKGGEDIDYQIQRQIEKARAEGREIDREEALEEVVADSMEAMFADGEVIKKLASENPNLAKRILAKIKEWLDALVGKYKTLDPDSEEGQKLKGWVDEFRQMQDMFVEALKGAKQGYAKAGVETGTEFVDATTGEDVDFSIREKEPPKKTITAYKVFYVKDGKLYPPMVANPGGADTPVGVWLDADVGTQAPDSKTGRKQVRAGGKGTQGGGGSLAFRPGWHLGEIPLATQFDRTNPETGKKELFPEQFVWAECEIAADKNYQDEAMSYGYTKNGKFQHSLAGLPRVPVDGYYQYRTNPNPETVPWLITGAMKVNRLLSDAEVNAILRENGLPEKHRVGGDKTLAELGLESTQAKSQEGKQSFSSRETEQLDSDYMAAVKAGDMETTQRMVDEAAERAMPDSKVRGENGKLLRVRHGTDAEFREFNTQAFGGKNGTAEGFGIYLTDNEEVSGAYGDRQLSGFANIKRPAYANRKTIKRSELAGLIEASCEAEARRMMTEDEYGSINEALRDTWVSNYVYTYEYSSMNAVYSAVAENILSMSDNDADIVYEVMNGQGIHDYSGAMDFYHNILTPSTGIDGIWQVWKNRGQGADANVILAFSSEQFKLADPVTYDEQGKVIPISERFNEEKADFSYSSRETSPAAKDSEQTAKDIRRRFGLRMSGGDIAEQIGALYEQIAAEMQKDTPDMAALDAAVAKVAAAIDEVRGDKAQRDMFAQAALDEIRGTKVFLDEKQVAEIKYKYGSLKAFTQKFFGDKITFTSDKSAGVSLDTLWQEWAGQYPAYFDAGTSSNDMPSALLDALDAMKNTTDESAAVDYKSLDAEIESAIWDGYEAFTAMRNSNRAILSNALESAAQTPEEKTNLARYRETIGEINAAEARVKEINAEIKELSFAKGERDTARIAELQKEKAALEKKITAADSRLLKLEASTPLKDLVRRTKENTRKAVTAEYVAREAALRKERDAEIERVRLEERWKGAEKSAELRRQRDEAIEAVREKYRQRIADMRGNRSKAETRRKLERLTSRLRQRLLRPSENKYVTKEFLKPVAEMLNMLSTYTGKSEKLLAHAKLLKDAYANAENRAALDAENLKAKGVDENGNPIDVDPVQEAIDNLWEVFDYGDKSVRDLTPAELDAVYQTANMIEHLVTTATKTISTAKARRFSELKEKAIKELKEGRGVFSYNLKTLRPKTVFEIFGNFTKDGTWSQIYEMLNDAALASGDITMDLNEVFAPLMPGDGGGTKVSQKTFDDFINPDEAVDIGLKDSNGNAYTVTHDMLVMLALSLDHPANYDYVVRNGFKAPNKDRYYKGRTGEAYDKGSARILPPNAKENNLLYKERNELRGELRETEDEDRRQEIRDRIEEIDALLDENLEAAREWADDLQSKVKAAMNDYDRQWYDAWRTFAEKSQGYLNEATQKMYGFDRATVENYFPIRTDSRFGEASFESLVHDFTLEGLGFMKERTGTGLKPLYLEGVSYIAHDHIRKVAQYAAMAPALRDFSKITGKTAIMEDGEAASLLDTLGTVYDKKARVWLENLIADLNGARKRDSWRLFGKLRSSYAGAVLTLNPSVSFAQIASAPTTAAVLGGKAVAKAYERHGLPFAGKADTELIAKWTSILYNRNMGYSERGASEQAGRQSRLEALERKAKFVFGWINAADNYTVNRIWWAAEYYVQDHMPELYDAKAETQSDEYYEAVAEMFERAIQETQPSYDVLQRPDILRNPNELVRSLTMFMTQRLQNYSIAYESSRRYARYRYDFKHGLNGVTSEDVKTAKMQLVNSATSLLVSSAMIVAFKTLAALMLYRLDPWRDEDEELTAASISSHILDMFADTMISNFLGGSEAYSLAKRLILGKDQQYYGVEVNGVERLNDTIDGITKLSDTIVQPLREGKDIEWDKAGMQFKKSGKTIVETVTGLPVTNAGRLADAAWNWASDFKDGKIDFEQNVERAKTTNARRLVNAFLAGDKEKVAEVEAQFEDKKDADTQVKKYVKAQYKDGKMTREDVTTILDGQVKMSGDDIDWWFEKVDAEIAGEDYGKYDDFVDAVKSGENLKAVVQKYLDRGVSKDTLRGRIKPNFDEAYRSASNAERAKMKGYLLNAYDLIRPDSVGDDKTAREKYREKKSKDIDKWLDGAE